MKTPTLEEIQGLRKFLDELTIPKRDLTVLSQAIEEALTRKDYSYALGLAFGSHLSPMGLTATEYGQIYLRISKLIHTDVKESLEDSDSSDSYSLMIK